MPRTKRKIKTKSNPLIEIKNDNGQICIYKMTSFFHTDQWEGHVRSFEIPFMDQVPLAFYSIDNMS